MMCWTFGSKSYANPTRGIKLDPFGGWSSAPGGSDSSLSTTSKITPPNPAPAQSPAGLPRPLASPSSSLAGHQPQVLRSPQQLSSGEAQAKRNATATRVVLEISSIGVSKFITNKLHQSAEKFLTLHKSCVSKAGANICHFLSGSCRRPSAAKALGGWEMIPPLPAPPGDTSSSSEGAWQQMNLQNNSPKAPDYGGDQQQWSNTTPDATVHYWSTCV